MNGKQLDMQDVNHRLFTESVGDEVMLSITDKQMTENDKSQRSEEILLQLDLSAYCDTHPMALSGGQKQRTAIASGSYYFHLKSLIH